MKNYMVVPVHEPLLWGGIYHLLVTFDAYVEFETDDDSQMSFLRDMGIIRFYRTAYNQWMRAQVRMYLTPLGNRCKVSTQTTHLLVPIDE